VPRHPSQISLRGIKTDYAHGLITGLLFTVTFGLVQNFLGQSPWAFWIAGVMLLAMLVVWWVAQAGKVLAAPQTIVLRHFLEDSLGLDRSQRELTDADPYHV
jgi:hypothetical protein